MDTIIDLPPPYTEYIPLEPVIRRLYMIYSIYYIFIVICMYFVYMPLYMFLNLLLFSHLLLTFILYSIT
jgi:hypothetical protein